MIHQGIARIKRCPPSPQWSWTLENISSKNSPPPLLMFASYFSLNEYNHLFASPAKEKENMLRRITSSGTLAIFTVLQCEHMDFNWVAYERD